MILEHLLETAIRAYDGTSFSPDRRGRNCIDSYSAELESDLLEIRKAAIAYGHDPENICDRYKEKYIRHFTAWLYTKSNCISSMIVGPAKFPVRRAEKFNNRERSKYDFFVQWRERAKKAIVKGFKPKETLLTELERAREDLQQREAHQETMKKANVIIRKAKGPMTIEAVDQLRGLSISEENIRELFFPKFSRGQGYQHWELSNNLQCIHRLRERVQLLESKAIKHVEGEKTDIVISGITITQNYEADRVQIVFPGKPESQTIAKLKKGGWRWSPSGGCWQRKLTSQATKDAQVLLKST